MFKRKRYEPERAMDRRGDLQKFRFHRYPVGNNAFRLLEFSDNVGQFTQFTDNFMSRKIKYIDYKYILWLILYMKF